MPQDNGLPKNKRKGPDLLISLINWISVAGWILIIAVLVIIGKAQPAMVTFWDRLLQTGVDSSWDIELAQYAFYLMVVLLFLGLAGLFMNSKRHKRKTDRYRVSLIVMTLFSVAGIAVYLLSLS